MPNQYMRTSNEVSAIVPQVWSQNYYDVLLADLPFNSLIDREYEGEIKGLGDTVKISTIPEFSDAGELPQEEAANEADAVTVIQQNLVINRMIVKDFIVTDKAKIQALPFVEKLKSLAVYSINKRIQAIILSLTVPSAAAPDHTLAAANSGVYGLADILAAKELLDNQNVPFSDRHKVMGAGPLNDVFNITGFTSSDFVAGNTPLISGQLPAQLLGFKPHFTSLVGSTVYDFHKSYFTLAAQKGMEVKEADLAVLGQRGYRVNTTTFIGAKQLSNTRVVTTSV